MGLSVMIPSSFFFGILISKQPSCSLFNQASKHHSVKILRMIPKKITKVECMGNTQIIHVEETEISKRAIGLLGWSGHR